MIDIIVFFNQILLISWYITGHSKYLEYLLAGETNPKVQERYLSQIIEKRSDPTNPDNWKDFNGDIVPKKNKNKIYLPKPFI